MPGERGQHHKESILQSNSKQMRTRRDFLKTQATELGLIKYPATFSRVWVEENYQEGEVPHRFFLGNYLNTGQPPTLEEFRLKLPISTVDDLIEALKTLDAFYYGTVDIIDYARSGTQGLIDYLAKFDLVNRRTKRSSEEVGGQVNLPKKSEGFERLTREDKENSHREPRHQHVIPRGGERWAIQASGAKRASRVLDSEEKAITLARRFVQNQGVDLIIHNPDGTPSYKESYGIGQKKSK